MSNLLIFKSYRRQGIGSALMARLRNTARAARCRMPVLETQSCNLPAIAFYQREGFHLIGLDTCSYSNEDVAKQEVRLEFGEEI